MNRRELEPNKVKMCDKTNRVAYFYKDRVQIDQTFVRSIEKNPWQNFMENSDKQLNMYINLCIITGNISHQSNCASCISRVALLEPEPGGFVEK